VVVGVDSFHNYYILDIDRFKTDSISEYFRHILNLHRKWDFRKLRAETTAAQEIIIKDLKDNYIRPHGLSLVIDPHKPTRNDGNKFERIQATLSTKYENRQMWHYRGGNCQTLEDELVLKESPHDDVKDALASAVEICIPPSGGISRGSNIVYMNKMIHERFGGIS
jgi:hypothetical protein